VLTIRERLVEIGAGVRVTDDHVFGQRGREVRLWGEEVASRGR
jgi:hypothetical protein